MSPTVVYFFLLFGVSCSLHRSSIYQSLSSWWPDEDDSLVSSDVGFPKRFSTTGEYLGNHLFEQSKRLQRDAPSPAPETFLYKLQGHGDEFELTLSARKYLLSSESIVQTLRRAETGEGGSVATLEPDANVASCHLAGVVKVGGKQLEGSAAVSVCDGNMTGVISLLDFDILIEPSTDEERHHSSEAHPHVLYKRMRSKRMEHRKGPACSVESNYGKEERHGRAERSAVSKSQCSTKSFVIETAVFIDPLTIQKHRSLGRENKLRDYILTLFNIANLLFDHCSTGYNITFSIVRMMFLEDWPVGFAFTKDSETFLERFCNWQATKNPPKHHPKHHDYSVLITGDVMCSIDKRTGQCVGSQPGRAFVGAMCRKRSSCQVSSDSGFRTGFVIAHETGHSFGMVHDGAVDDNCDGSAGYLMSAYIVGGRNLYTWSSCSLRHIQSFIESKTAANGFCVLDGESSRSKEKLPGETYSLREQCVYQTGRNDSKLCPNRENICNSLWCLDYGGCSSLHIPAADGSPCGEEQICIRGHCVPLEDKNTFGQSRTPVDGGWGNYSNFGDCSRQCNIGVQIRKRRCDNPRPRYGGKLCEGLWVELQLCNKQPCSPPTDWRRRSCEQYKDANGNPLLPYFWPRVCNLICYDRVKKSSLSFDILAPDGVFCSDKGSDFCYKGQCKKFGCDNCSDSSETDYDNCGVCGGDGSSCSILRWSNRKEFLLPKQRDLVHSIPPGAQRIFLYSMNFSAFTLFNLEAEGIVKTIALNTHLLTHENGFYKRSEVLESTIHVYKQKGHLAIEIFGPITLWLNVWVENLATSPKKMNIFLQYAKPNNCSKIEACRLDGNWTEWKAVKPCSRTCGGGTTTWTRSCTNPRPGSHGKSCEGSDVKNAICNPKPCPVKSINFFTSQCNENLGKDFIALGHRTGLAKCQVLCWNGQGKFIWAKDGTRCNFGVFGDARCLRQRCVKFGCDGVYDSSAEADMCGVCNGDGSTCASVNGQYRIKNLLRGSYDVVTVPAGAQRFTVELTIPLGRATYIDLRDAGSRHLVYSSLAVANYRQAADYAFDAEITFNRRSPYTMMLAIAGDIPFPIVVQLVLSGDPGIAPHASYSYYYSTKLIPSGGSSCDYAWSWERSSCSLTCGFGGKYQYVPRCYAKATGNPVDESLCSPQCAGSRPSVRLAQVCFVQVCPPTMPPPSSPTVALLPTTSSPSTTASLCPRFRWEVLKRPCNATCGKGYRKQTVRCINECTKEKRGRKMCERYVGEKPAVPLKVQCFLPLCSL